MLTWTGMVCSYELRRHESAWGSVKSVVQHEAYPGARHKPFLPTAPAGPQLFGSGLKSCGPPTDFMLSLGYCGVRRLVGSCGSGARGGGVLCSRWLTV